MRTLPSIALLTALAVPLLTFAPGASAQNKGPFPESNDPALRDPSQAKAVAPQTFTAKFETSQGDFEVDCTREWAPFGVDRFYNLVKIGFFSDVAFFRVMNKPTPFVVQFGIHGNPEVSSKWKAVKLPVDEVKQSNTRGMLTYAMAGGSAATRTTQLFVNYGNNVNLDGMGFAPICKVKGDGMDVLDKLYSGYAGAPSDAQQEIESEGNAFLRDKFPELDYIKGASITAEGDATPASAVKAPPPGSGDTGGSSTWTYVGLGIAGAIGIYFLMTMGKTKEPEKPAPARAPARSVAATPASAPKKKKKKPGTGGPPSGGASSGEGKPAGAKSGAAKSADASAEPKPKKPRP